MEKAPTFLLNTPSAFLPLDKNNLLGIVAELPDHCRCAYNLIPPLPDLPDRINQVIICGQGGSGIGGELLQTYMYGESSIPISITHSYLLPKWVDENSLVFTVSYSGETEETISCFLEACRRGAFTIAISTGGQLGSLAAEKACPLIKIPAGLYPRSALGYLFVSLLGAFEHLGLLQRLKEELMETVELLKALNARYGPQSPIEENKAKQLAATLAGKVPLIYGTQATAAIALRWKTQFNENSKNFAHANFFPELNHNEIVGLSFPQNILPMLAPVILQDLNEHPRMQKQIQAATEFLARQIGAVSSIMPEGKGKLARLLSLLFLGDYASLYLAFLNRVDPAPILPIEELKTRLLD